MTINTSDYGGMPGAHAKFHEFDREIVGSVWEVVATDVERGDTIKIGRLLFEGSTSGVRRLTAFDEMLGCTPCIDMYHKEVRYGPFLADDDGSVRRPIAAERLYNKGSTCRLYKVTGSSKDSSVTFEGGPYTEMNFPNDGKFHDLWSEGAALVTTTSTSTTTTTTSTTTTISKQAKMKYFSQKRCSGEPVHIPAAGKGGAVGGTWGGLGKQVSRSRCKRLCLAEEVCDFAVCKLTPGNRKMCDECSAFAGETCDKIKTPGQKFRTWKKTYSRRLRAGYAQDAELTSGLLTDHTVVLV